MDTVVLSNAITSQRIQFDLNLSKLVCALCRCVDVCAFSFSSPLSVSFSFHYFFCRQDVCLHFDTWSSAQKVSMLRALTAKAIIVGYWEKHNIERKRKSAKNRTPKLLNPIYLKLSNQMMKKSERICVRVLINTARSSNVHVNSCDKQLFVSVWVLHIKPASVGISHRYPFWMEHLLVL